MLRYTMLMVFAGVSMVHAEERQLNVTAPPYFLPAPKALVVVPAGAPGPGAPKHESLGSVSKLNTPLTLKSDGPFDLWYVPTDGRALQVLKAFKPSQTKTEIKLNDYLGVLAVKGADQPRGKLLVTPYDDEGPETKKHTVIQTASDVRTEIALPPGDYALWLVPANGARPRKIADKLRLLAGKTITVD